MSHRWFLKKADFYDPKKKIFWFEKGEQFVFKRSRISVLQVISKGLKYRDSLGEFSFIFLNLWNILNIIEAHRLIKVTLIHPTQD